MYVCVCMIKSTLTPHHRLPSFCDHLNLIQSVCHVDNKLIYTTTQQRPDYPFRIPSNFT